MSKHDMLKAQTCVLRVNIHCEGCMHKVKKKLQKVDGVYKVNIDSEQGRVIVSGNADPASLIEKLEKAGKHAELWGGSQKPVPVFITNDQLKKFQMEKNGKNKGNHDHKNGNGFPQIHHDKGFKDDKLFSAKDQKSVRFNLPEDDEFDDEFDEDDDEFDDDEEFDDESDDEFGEGGFDGHKPPAKAAANGVGHKAGKAGPNGHHKGEKEGKPKKGGGGGGGLDMFLKGMFRKAGGRKKGDSDKKSKKEDKKKNDNGKHGGKKGGFELGDLKKGKNDDGRSKKGGEGFDGGKQHQHQHQHQQQMFNEMMKASRKGGGGGGGDGGGGGGGGGGGRNMMDPMMGQKGGFPAVAGMPAMNGGQFMPGPGNNPNSQQQQYMAHMMMMNQQRENGHGAYHPSAYAARPPQPAMSYGPPPGMMYGAPAPPMSYGAPTEPYTNMFSDENTDSCRIM